MDKEVFKIEAAHKLDINTPMPELIADILDWISNCVQLWHRETPYSDALVSPLKSGVPKMPVQIQLLVDLS